MIDVESACRAAALRYLTLADQEQDAVRRLGLLDLAAGALSAARDHAVVVAGRVLAERTVLPEPRR